MEANDLIPFKPGTAVQTPGFRNPWTFLSIEENKIMVVFLIYSKKAKIFDRDIWPLYGTGRPTPTLKDNVLNFVLTSMVDILVVGGISAPNTCKPLDKILVPDILNEVKSIPTTDTAITMLSIARCGIALTPMNLDIFKHDLPTPGRRNECLGDKMEIDDNSFETEKDEYCMDLSSVGSSGGPDLGREIDQTYHNPPQECPPSDIIPEDSANLDLELETALKKKCEIQNSDNDQNQNEIECQDKGEWNEISLSPEDITKIKTTQSGTMPNDYQLSKAKHWLEYLEDTTNPEKSRYRCKICNKYHRKYHVKEHLLPELAKDEGVLKDTKQANTYIIAHHERKSNVHQYLLHQRKLAKKQELENQISGMIKDKINDQDNFAVTNRHMRIVLASAKMCLSFNAHPILVYLHQKSGVDMGHLCATNKAAKRLAMSMSKTMKNILKAQLKKERSPLSIILDSSTARRVPIN